MSALLNRVKDPKIQSSNKARNHLYSFKINYDALFQQTFRVELLRLRAMNLAVFSIKESVISGSLAQVVIFFTRYTCEFYGTTPNIRKYSSFFDHERVAAEAHVLNWQRMRWHAFIVANSPTTKWPAL